MDRTTGRAAYRACRDILVRHRDDSPPSQRFAGTTSATSSTGRSTGSIPSRLPIEPRPTRFSPHARRNVAPYHGIRRIEFMELPKAISGNIRRVELRSRENACKPNDLTDEDRDR
jgi:hypothetical protein